MLRVSALELPDNGWGRIHVVEADVSFDEPGEPKTGPRIVPIPPVLAGMLSDWVASNGLSGSALLFRTRSGRRPSASNWCRALHRAASHRRATAYARLRLPARGGDDLAACWCPTGRGRASHGPQRRDTGAHLRRRPRERRRGRERLHRRTARYSAARPTANGVTPRGWSRASHRATSAAPADRTGADDPT